MKKGKITGIRECYNTLIMNAIQNISGKWEVNSGMLVTNPSWCFHFEVIFLILDVLSW